MTTECGALAVTKEQLALYRCYLGLKPAATAKKLVAAANQWGFKAELKRDERGYSTRLAGGSSKLPDDIWVLFGGERYGSGHASALSFAERSLAEFAEDVLAGLSEGEMRDVQAAYHLACLKDLGFSVWMEVRQ